MENIKVIITWDENYSAYSDDFKGVYATAHTLEEMKKEFADAMEFHIENLEVDEIPDNVKNGYTLEFEMNVKALLYYYDGILSRSALSRLTGINERQLGHYATGHRNPRPAQRKKIVKGINKLGKEFIELV